MSSGPQPAWIPWVDGVRHADAAAREELVTYFTPFVHGVLVCHVAVHVANANVAPVLDDLLGRLREVPHSKDFGTWLLDHARRRAAQLATTPGATLELPGGGPTFTEGKKTLSRLRHLPEPTRERLAFRLLEGIPGAEIAELTGAAPGELRGDLEQGFATLVRELGGVSVTAVGDTYLWSMVGTPHPAVVPLENQLTPLRYDPSSTDPSAVETAMLRANPPEVTPVQSPSPLERRSNEGRRQTSPEMKTVVPRPAPDDEPSTTPIGVRLVDEATSVVPGNDAGAVEATRHATDLPVAAKENPFAAQPSTIPASDLPAAAGVERSSRPRPAEETRAAEPSNPLAESPTMLRPLTMEVPARSPVKRAMPDAAAKEDPDTTAARGTPISILARNWEPPSSGALTPVEAGQDWRTSVGDYERPRAPERPEPFSFTRGATPFAMATVFFVFFVAVAYINVRGSERNARLGWNLVPVTVAAQSIPEGSVVDFDMISTREVPEQFVTASVVKPESVTYVLNQRIMVPVQAGDPLLWSQFETARSNERLSRRIHHRARAYTIPTAAAAAVGYWVRPGDRVDIIISLQDPVTKQREATTTLQNIQVLATGKITQNTNVGLLNSNQRMYHDVSVIGLPEEIEILALMRQKAQYRMVLRNEEDYEMLEAKKTNADTLISGERVKLLQRKRTETLIPLIRNRQEPKR